MSTEQYTVERLFADRPEALRLYRIMAAHIEGLGGITATVTKAQVAFGADRKFAWLWPTPGTRSKAEDALMLTLDMRHSVSDPLIVSVEETYPGKWTHQIRITDKSVIDHVIGSGWLDAALDFGTKEPK